VGSQRSELGVSTVWLLGSEVSRISSGGIVNPVRLVAERVALTERGQF